jgi:hypothetical protein
MSIEGVLYLVAAFLAFSVGVAHSVLGERYILIRLFRRSDLPQLLGSTEFTTRTLRFAWHLTTIAWWGAAALFFALAQSPLTSSRVSVILGVMFLLLHWLLLLSRVAVIWLGLSFSQLRQSRFMVHTPNTALNVTRGAGAPAVSVF